MLFADVEFPLGEYFLDEEKQGGGPLIDIGTHALDLTLWIMNNYEPKVVLGTAYHKFHGKKMPLTLGVHGIRRNSKLKTLHLR